MNIVHHIPPGVRGLSSTMPWSFGACIMTYAELIETLATAIVNGYTATKGTRRLYVNVHVGRAQTTDDRWTLCVKSTEPTTGSEVEDVIGLADYAVVYLTGKLTEAKTVAALVVADATDDAGEIGPFSFDITAGVLSC